MSKNQSINNNMLDRAKACAASFEQTGNACGGCFWYSKCGIGDRDRHRLIGFLDSIDPLGKNITLFSLPHFPTYAQMRISALVSLASEQSSKLGHVLRFEDIHELGKHGKYELKGRCAVCKGHVTIAFVKDKPEKDAFVTDNMLTEECLDPVHTWEFETLGMYINSPGGDKIKIELFDNGLYIEGRHYLSYKFMVNGETIFAGSEYGYAPTQYADYEDMTMGLLFYMVDDPDESGSSAFESYTPEQLDFARGEIAEELRLFEYDYENAKSES